MKPIWHFIKYFLLVCFAFPLNLDAQTRIIGTNISGLEYWQPQIIFKDAFKQCGEWLTRNVTSGGPWNTGATIPMRQDGYPTEVPFGNPGQQVHTLMFLDAGGAYPGGTYQILSEGSGSIQLEWDSGNRTFISPCNNSFTVTPTNQGIHLTITASDINNPVRNIRIILPGFQDNYLSDPFYPRFINYLDSANLFSGIRFMDLMKTNFSPVKQWNQRTTKEYYSQTTDYGIAYEYMIQLCNRLNKDMWICIPHQADNNFIEQFAIMLRDSLEQDRKIYIEYSNETWNSVFSQTKYCNEQGALSGYTGQPWEQGWKFYAKRSADCHRIFETVFGINNSRIIKVVASQSANSWLGNQIMSYYNSNSYNLSQTRANALAIAPYFGGHIADSIGNAGAINSISVSQILDAMRASVNSQTLAHTKAYKTIAEKYNMDLIAYEGGQHLSAINYQNNQTLTDKLIEANRSPEIEEIYCDMFDAWFNNGGKQFFNFSSSYKPNKYGSWGVIENTEQPLSKSFKWLALNQCGRDKIITMENPFSKDIAEIKVYPNPNNGVFTIEINNPDQKIVKAEIFNSVGQKCQEKCIQGDQVHFDLNKISSGIYWLKIEEKDQAVFRKIFIN